jgi:hypothetical protein
MTPEPTAITPVSEPTVTLSAGSETTATPQVRNSLVGLRRQGFTPAILLAGDLLLLSVALVIVIIDRRRRLRER